MQASNEFIIKVYEDGNVRIPIGIRKKLSINKGSNLVLKLEKNGSINIDTVDHKIEELRQKICANLNSNLSLVDEFINFKKFDNSKY